MIKIILFSLLVFLSIKCIAQHDMQRFGFYVPLDRVALDSNRFMHDLDFIGLYERGYGSRGENLKHSMVFGGSGTFYRWDNSVLWFSVIGQVMADPYNDISFDPYGASWQEELRYAQQFDIGVFEIGFGHRCRHEIDNYDPGEKDGLSRRVTLYAGPVFGYLSPMIELSEDLPFTWGIDGQYIVVGSDYRNPDNTANPDISNLDAKLTPHLEANYHINNSISVFTRALTTFNLIDSELYMLYRAETGITIKGNMAGIDLYCLYEDMFDDYRSPVPEPNSTISIGARISSDLYR